MANILYAIFGIIFLGAIFALFKSPNLFTEIPGLAVLLLLALIFFILSIERATYKILVTDDGLLVEKRLFFIKRTLKIDEIESISPKAYSSDSVLKGSILHGVRPKVQAPKIINSKYTNFPTYIMSDDFFSHLTKAYPQIQVDPNLKF